jgi:hypothetical protein
VNATHSGCKSTSFTRQRVCMYGLRRRPNR